MPKVVHIITELNVGGAENALYQLILHTDRETFKTVVISLEDKGTFGEPIEALDVPVHTLNINPARPNPLALLTLIRILRREKPDIVHAWLYHAIVAASVTMYFMPRTVLGWNIRNATVVNFRNRTKRLIFNACARLSRRADFIIANTEVGHKLHVDAGYHDGHWQIIYNGFDADHFKPDAAARKRIRDELALPDTALVIGQVGRLTPEKNYPGFIAAALNLLETQPDVQFVAVGKDVTPDSLGTLIPPEQRGHFHLLDMRRDIAAMMNAFDVFTLTSDFEGFPNVVGEAMATGLPCAVTDAGDTAQLVGDAGIIVPAGDMDAMVAAWSRLLAMSPEERAELGAAARARIVTQFGIAHFVKQYTSLYQNILRSERNT